MDYGAISLEGPTTLGEPATPPWMFGRCGYRHAQLHTQGAVLLEGGPGADWRLRYSQNWFLVAPTL